MTLAEMMAKEQDWVVIFNIERIEEAVKKGDFQDIGGVPVLDGRHGSPFTRYVPVANSPHGINTAPDGIHFVANGKLSPTVDRVRRAQASTISSTTRSSRAMSSSPSRSWDWGRSYGLRRKGQRLHDAVSR